MRMALPPLLRDARAELHGREFAMGGGRSALVGDPPLIPIRRVVAVAGVLRVARPGREGEAAPVAQGLRHDVGEAADHRPVQDPPLPAPLLEDVDVVAPELEDAAAVFLLDQVIGPHLAADPRPIAVEVDFHVAYRVHGSGEPARELRFHPLQEARRRAAVGTVAVGRVLVVDRRELIPVEMIDRVAVPREHVGDRGPVGQPAGRHRLLRGHRRIRSRRSIELTAIAPIRTAPSITGLVQSCAPRNCSPSTRTATKKMASTVPATLNSPGRKTLAPRKAAARADSRSPPAATAGSAEPLCAVMRTPVSPPRSPETTKVERVRDRVRIPSSWAAPAFDPIDRR